MLTSPPLSGSLFLFKDGTLETDLLPIRARSFVVASLMTGRTLSTASLNAGSVVGTAKSGGFENGSCNDQNVV